MSITIYDPLLPPSKQARFHIFGGEGGSFMRLVPEHIRTCIEQYIDADGRFDLVFHHRPPGYFQNELQTWMTINNFDVRIKRNFKQSAGDSEHDVLNKKMAKIQHQTYSTQPTRFGAIFINPEHAKGVAKASNSLAVPLCWMKDAEQASDDEAFEKAYTDVFVDDVLESLDIKFYSINKDSMFALHNTSGCPTLTIQLPLDEIKQLGCGTNFVCDATKATPATQPPALKEQYYVGASPFMLNKAFMKKVDARTIRVTGIKNVKNIDMNMFAAMDTLDASFLTVFMFHQTLWKDETDTPHFNTSVCSFESADILKCIEHFSNAGHPKHPKHPNEGFDLTCKYIDVADVYHVPTPRNFVLGHHLNSINKDAGYINQKVADAKKVWTDFAEASGDENLKGKLESPIVPWEQQLDEKLETLWVQNMRPDVIFDMDTNNTLQRME